MNNIYVPEIAKIIRIDTVTPTEKIFDVSFVDKNMQKNFNFEPGQFVECTVFGVGEAPFCLASNPNNKDKFQLCVRSIGNVSNALHNMKEGSRIGIRGPFGKGTFPCEEARGNNVLVVAGGLGLPPLMSFLTYIMDNRDDYKKVMIIYGAVNPESILFKNDIQYLSTRDDISVCLTVDNPDEKWTGEIGVCTKLIPRVDFPPDNTCTIVCGPPVMYKYVVQELEKKNFKEDRIFLSLERRMECGVGKCNHCHIGNKMVCIDGPVFSLWEIRNLKEAI
ncbi:MAG: FAD/NAD(P)-binding protein [Actinobacteria bacterium]|nr:FAD/NAD(P)-binding protein [Actinomycetota bacterium]